VTAAFTADGPVAAGDPVLGYRIADSNQQVCAKIVDLDSQQQMVSEIWGLQVRITDADGNTLLQGDFKTAAFSDIWMSRSSSSAIMPGVPPGARIAFPSARLRCATRRRVTRLAPAYIKRVGMVALSERLRKLPDQLSGPITVIFRSRPAPTRMRMRWMVTGRGVVLSNMIWRCWVNFTDCPTSAGIQSDAFAPAKSAQMSNVITRSYLSSSQERSSGYTAPRNFR